MAIAFSLLMSKDAWNVLVVLLEQVISYDSVKEIRLVSKIIDKIKIPLEHPTEKKEDELQTVSKSLILTFDSEEYAFLSQQWQKLKKCFSGSKQARERIISINDAFLLVSKSNNI